MYKTAIKEMQDAYMPNAQRKQQYLAIYDDITKQNETLISFLIQLSNKRIILACCPTCKKKQCGQPRIISNQPMA